MGGQVLELKAFNEVFDHYRQIDQVGLPLVLYNIPQTAGTHFRWWTAEGMGLAFENVIGMKDSSGDMPFFMAALEKLKGTIGLFVGHDEVVGVMGEAPESIVLVQRLADVERIIKRRSP